MTLVDTSVWANHFRSAEPDLIRLLEEGHVGMHPFVIGELAAGSLKNRASMVADFAALPQASIASEAEVHHLLESHRLWGTGLGWIDLHLLTSAMLAGWQLFTTDRAMVKAAEKLSLARR